MSGKILPNAALQKGPDLFLPGSRTQRGFSGVGIHTFIYTKYPDANKNHLFLAPANIQHINLIHDNPGILTALFGKNLVSHLPEITYKAGGKTHYDFHAIRRISIEFNLFGRTGYFKNNKVFMFWQISDWQMAFKALSALECTDSDIVTVGYEEIGTVAAVRGLKCDG